MSNRFFQGVVFQLKESIDRTVGVIDEYGTIIACSDLIKIGEKRENVIPMLSTTMDIVKDTEYTYKPISNNNGLEYVAVVDGVIHIDGNTGTVHRGYQNLGVCQRDTDERDHGKTKAAVAFYNYC